MTFFRLALGNVRRSLRDYAVYFVTLVLGVAVFYAFNTIADQADFLSTMHNETLNMLSQVMAGLTVFLAVVLGFLMVYANNFLIRRRKRELGIYQVLGMSRGKVSLIMVLETLLASFASFVVGLLVGVLLSQLLIFVSATLFRDTITQFHFMFSGWALAITSVSFGLMFLVMLGFNLRTVAKVSLIDLMGASRRNESVLSRNLPASVAVFILGLAAILVAYWRLDAQGLPMLGTSSMLDFLITTLVVVVGTFLLFFGLGNIVFLCSRALRSHYYRGLNMFTARQLASRINTSSASSAIVCLILFLAITSVSTGMSVCTILTRYIDVAAPYDATIVAMYNRQLDEGNPDDYVAATAPVDVAAQLRRKAPDFPTDVDTTLATLYGTEPGQGVTLRDLFTAASEPLPAGFEGTNADTYGLDVMDATSFNAWRASKGLPAIEVGEDGYLLVTDMGDILGDLYGKVMSRGVKITINGHELRPAQTAPVVDASSTFQNGATTMNTGVVVVPDAAIEGLAPSYGFINLMYKGDNLETDAALNKSVEEAFGDGTRGFTDNSGNVVGYYTVVSTKTELGEQAVGVSGLVSYMAIYIGFVLVVSCAAILAIQQLSSTSDSASRYALLARIGCPSRLIGRSILRQTLFFFLFPLLVALAHSIVALRSVLSVFAALGRPDLGSASLGCGMLFVLVYGGYFLVTYVVSRGVVAVSGMRGGE